jgi:hypothetical protein
MYHNPVRVSTRVRWLTANYAYWHLCATSHSPIYCVFQHDWFKCDESSTSLIVRSVVVHVTIPRAFRGRCGYLHHDCYILCDVMPPNNFQKTSRPCSGYPFRSQSDILYPLRIKASYRVSDARSPAYSNRQTKHAQCGLHIQAYLCSCILRLNIDSYPSLTQNPSTGMPFSVA